MEDIEDMVDIVNLNSREEFLIFPEYLSINLASSILSEFFIIKSWKRMFFY